MRTRSEIPQLRNRKDRMVGDIFWAFISLIACLCFIQGCAKPDPYPVLRVRDWDPNNNRVTEDGQLVRWTNFGIGFRQGTNWIKVLEAQEK